MSKRYILSKEDLQNLIHESMTFFSEKGKSHMESGRQVRFSDRTRWIDEFLSLVLREYPIDNLLDDIDKELSSEY